LSKKKEAKKRLRVGFYKIPTQQQERELRTRRDAAARLRSEVEC
jgi:hypothetical protein